MPRRFPGLSPLVPVLVVGCALLGTGRAGADPAPAAPPAKPAAVVALGDSVASGEGAGGYVAGTRGERGNWCHRSPNAYVQRTGLPGRAINLACSGARSTDVAFGAPGHYTERSQAQRLAEVARTNRVTAVLVQLGANDEPAFGSTMVSCVAVFLSPGRPNCTSALAKQWPDRLASMAPRVERALGDVRAAMRRAGYADRDYQLVLLSYPSPVTETMTRTHGLTGCPFRAEDARWGRAEGVPQLSTALRAVADRAGARFLDLSRATEGHEACVRGGNEWMRRLTVNPRAFVDGGVTAVGHLAQESFHLNAVGHRQIGGCIGPFVRGDDRRAACRVGSDGALHVVSAVPAG